MMRQRDKTEHAKIVRTQGPRIIRKKPKKKSEAGMPKGVPPLAGVLAPNTPLMLTYKKANFRAKVDANGRLEMNGKVYNSPSAAGSMIRGGKNTDGWLWWKYRRADGAWVKIDELRNK
jgi:hypothetical protein